MNLLEKLKLKLSINSLVSNSNSYITKIKKHIKNNIKQIKSNIYKDDVLIIDYCWHRKLISDIYRTKEYLLELKNYSRKDQKNERLQLIRKLEMIIQMTAEDYYFFNQYFAPVTTTKKYNEEMLNKERAHLLELQREIYQEFSNIYYHFKRTAKPLDDIPMKQILSQMKNAYHLGEKLPNTPLQYEYISYNSTTN